MDTPEKGHYDATISTSKEASIAKAMEIMMDDIRNKQKIQVIVRPRTSVLLGVIPLIAYITAFILLLFYSQKLSELLSFPVTALRIIIAIISLLIFTICLKPFLIWLILMYQRFAPEKIRKLCYYEPSCSEYMRLSIKKYGVLRGVYKGCKRLLRCHWPNGGIDYP